MAKTLTLRGVAFSSLFAALVVVFGYVSIPLGFTPVPITLQTLAVMLAGGLLGARYGFFSMMMIVVLTALGFPLLQGKGGIPAILGPTGGYVVMWPIAALLIGLLVNKVRSNGWVGYVLIFLIMACFGSLLLYVSGVPWLAHVAGFSMSKALAAGFYPYIPGDIIKAIAAAIITVSLRQVFPQARLTGHGHYAVRQTTWK
ncbi:MULTISPECIES: biotin transporter BioY [unclassified Paenibacillus]|uniref:biotin transporter BioY n=1 Tax=unclassified Paenibacillus TaxID=185978 RepID=UPI001AE1AE90|nr:MULTISPECIES: biotin transporter BioY [unclassified Paenibacillus]MBP1155561.1 biotin transport system substrate-specific component [Paenibacillus sp. PvP091]MBP1169053.1 biotin transport system substrate-specific component [Paenibacillus sp. PvR098]MBP2440081.1 biotin transport system substrate-specific component [Paenibacillus sp. PvP052]